MDKTRRNFLAVAGLTPLALLGLGSARADSPAACYDPATLPFNQKSRRRSVSYVEVSTDPNKRCSACAFFTGTQAGCGTCTILGGGPVNAGAVCLSFAPKG
jgi:hypothetical protein